MLIVGLTGGLATGKSTVAKYFENLGAKVLDADAVVRELYVPGGDVWKKLVKAFGRGILMPDRSVDRKKLAAIVFSNRATLNRLNRIVHPSVLKRIQEEIKDFSASQDWGILVLNVPLLYESGLQKVCDKTVVVTARQRTQLDRLFLRDGMAREEASKRIAAQLPLADKAKRADFVIDNDGGLENTREQVLAIWSELARANTAKARVVKGIPARKRRLMI